MLEAVVRLKRPYANESKSVHASTSSVQASTPLCTRARTSCWHTHRRACVHVPCARMHLGGRARMNLVLAYTSTCMCARRMCTLADATCRLADRRARLLFHVLASTPVCSSKCRGDLALSRGLAPSHR